MSKQTRRAGRRLATGAALIALVVGIVAVGQAASGQAAAPTAPYSAPVPTAPPPPPGAASVDHDRLSAEVRAAAREAVRAGREARRDAMREKAEAMRDAAEARREAFAAAAEAREMAFAERSKAMRDLPARIAASMAQARQRMAASCAARGVTMPPAADFGALATCGHDYRSEVRTALVSARSSVAGAKGMADSDRAAALTAIDQALRGLDRAPRRGPTLQ